MNSRGVIEGVCNAAVGAFAVWTLLANGAVLLGGSLRQLLAAAIAVAVVAVVAVATRRRTGWVRTDASNGAYEHSGRHTRMGRALALVAAAAISGSYAATANLTLLWALGLALAAALAAAELRSHPVAQALPPRAPAEGGRRALVLVGLCLLCAFVTLIAHKPDLDDAFYANLAVAAADHPNAALLAGDTLHGVEGVPLPLPVYRVHALELLAGAVAYVTPLRALDVAHVLIPTLAALLVPLAYARLFWLLIPGQWLWGVALAVGFLVGVGDASHGYGSFAFVRMQQGKAILLTLALPMIAAYALEFAAAPTRARWLRLALAQIAAVGLSASALWVAPAVAGLALASARPLRSGSLRNLAVGLAASAYPLLLALVLRAETSATFAAAGTVRESGVMFEEAIRVVMGRNPIGYVTLFCVLGAWALTATALGRRFAVIFMLAFLLVFWNPFTAGWIAAHVTSPLTYWRVFWLLPVPALVGLALAGPLAADGSRRSDRLRGLAIASLAAILFLWLPARHPASDASGVRLAPPGWKIAPPALAAARAVRDHAPEGALVLAPASVAAWITALHRHPQPLVVRRGYLALLRNALGQSELDRRAQLELLVSGARRPPHSDRLLREAIARGPLTAVCIAQSTNRWPDVRAALEASGFQSVMRNSEYEVFAPSAGPRMLNSRGRDTRDIRGRHSKGLRDE